MSPRILPKSSSTPDTITSRNSGSVKIETARVIFDVGQKIFNYGKAYYERNFTYTVTINDEDPFYEDILDWLTTIMPDEKHHALTVTSSRTPSHFATPVSEREPSSGVTPLIVRFNQNVEKMILIDGHKVFVAVIVPEVSEKNLAAAYFDRPKIQFMTRSFKAQQAVLHQLEDLNAQRGKARKAVLRMVNNWNQWTTRSDIPPRSLESVSLPNDQKEKIVADLKNFLDSEDRYNRLAIPWHRGYMFEGPPGTGKTSLVKALANHFNLDLWYISLSDLKSDASLIGLLSEVGPRSILLLEDIDTARITHDRDGEEQGKISMSSLLNALDGVATPHGLVAIMTTNRFDILDEALTRAGRMDIIEHLDYPTIATIIDMYHHFYGVNPRWPGLKIDKNTPLNGVSTSEIAEAMKRHMDDPKGGSMAVKALIDKAQLV